MGGSTNPGGAARDGDSSPPSSSPPSSQSTRSSRASSRAGGSASVPRAASGPALRKGRWTQPEIARLREVYGLRDDHQIARELNRSVQSVRRMADQVFAAERRTGPWTAEEVLRLKRYLGATTNETIARILGRDVSEIVAQIGELGRIQRSGRWSREELSELKRLYGTRTDDDLARVFGRSLDSIQAQAEKLALAKDKAFLRRLDENSVTRMPRWTDQELETLRELYPLLPNLDIAQRLNRSVKSVVSKAHNMGLRKDPQRLREMGRENVSLRYQPEDEDEGAEPASSD